MTFVAFIIGDIFDCGCSLPEGACDWGRNVDPCGVCSGDGSAAQVVLKSLRLNFDPTAIVGASVSTNHAGCTYEYACNYDPEATIDDFISPANLQLFRARTDISACNYNQPSP